MKHPVCLYFFENMRKKLKIKSHTRGRSDLVLETQGI